MKVLYCARMARYDLLRPTVHLARYISMSDETCDRKLLRLMSYINSTLDKRQMGWVGNRTSEVSCHVYADADFAECVGTQRSTTGVHLCIEASHTHFPLHAVSKRQDCVSTSTPEAELVAGCHALKSVLMPALDVWQILLPADSPSPVFHEDNQAMIQVVKTGRNATMRHLNRTHRVSVAWLHENLGPQKEQDSCASSGASVGLKHAHS